MSICKPLQNRQDVYQTFRDSYVDVKTPVELLEYDLSGTTDVTINATVKIDGKRKTIAGQGNGPIDAYLHALNSMYSNSLKLQSYGQHDLQGGAEADAICCISISHEQGRSKFGVGINPNTTHASLMAVTVAADRAILAKGSTADSGEAFESLCSISANIQYKGQIKAILGSGNGPVAAFVSGVKTYFDEAKSLKLVHYSQSARGASKAGQDSEAVCAIACSLDDNRKRFGMGLDVNTNTASAKAVLSSLTLLTAMK